MKNNNFETSDFWLASTLMALGEQLLDVDRSNTRRAVFVFVLSSTLENCVELYRNRKVNIEPQSLFVQTKLLKNRLYEQ